MQIVYCSTSFKRKSRRPTRVRLPNARHRASRLAWARQYTYWSVEDRKRLAWCDESKFRLLDAEGRVRVPASLNAIRYVELLGDHLHPCMLFCYPHGNGVFKQDNCISNKSRFTTGWLEKHSSDFSVINWTPRSTDLNPIEYI
ncbi:transposable element Tcb2 transposase [Trichonephila clavipes]|nr:transposable element Tcb2 transposase [Trichonephila clavipes]